jgi:hypothetical protein
VGADVLKLRGLFAAEGTAAFVLGREPFPDALRVEEVAARRAKAACGLGTFLWGSRVVNHGLVADGAVCHCCCLKGTKKSQAVAISSFIYVKMCFFL